MKKRLLIIALLVFILGAFLAVSVHAASGPRSNPDKYLVIAEESTISAVPGDANMDGDINTRDVVLIKQTIVGMKTLTDDQKYYADAYDDGTGDINTRDVVLILQYIVGMDVKLGHTHVMTLTEAREASCTEDGNVEYWSCTACGKLYADSEGDREISLAETVVPASHKLSYYEPNEASCTEDGNVEYWTCTACGKLYADSEGDRELSLAETVVPAMHTGGTEIKNEKAASEYKDGYSGDVYCLGCGGMISHGVVLPHTSQMPAIVVSDVSTEAHTVRVVISIVNNPGIVSLKFSVLYDSKLSIQSVEFADALGSYVTSPEPYINPQIFNWISFGENVLFNGEFVVITFVVSSDVAEDETAEIRIIPNNENIFDQDQNQIRFDSVGETVTIGR